MTGALASTPRADGFAMPGEFEPHTACWMLWPSRPDTWRAGAAPARDAFARVASAISESEPVRMGVLPADLDSARDLLPNGVEIVPMAYDDAWMRDTGPTCVVDRAGRVRGVDWRFNAWGGLYTPSDADRKVAGQVLRHEGLERYQAPLVMEGGALHCDGQGTVLVTEQCLLNPNRNPDLDRAGIEGHLRDHLGVEAVVWLGDGVYNDETDGHVDNLACFVRPGAVALTWCDDPADPQYEISRAAQERLATAVDARGRRLKIHKLEQPRPMFLTAAEADGLVTIAGNKARRAGDRLAASYANFYIANQAIVAPTFGDPNDAAATAKLAELFPGRKIVGLPGREILLGGGNIHCITQQIPKPHASRR